MDQYLILLMRTKTTKTGRKTKAPVSNRHTHVKDPIAAKKLCLFTELFLLNFTDRSSMALQKWQKSRLSFSMNMDMGKTVPKYLQNDEHNTVSDLQ